MANKDDYLTQYRKFFEHFAETVNPHDQLPVKLACYKLVNVEVVGGIIDWTTQYLTQKQCPENLIAPLIKIIIDEIRKACKKHPVACGYNTSDEAYEPLKLMQFVMAKTNEVCLRYLDNSMLCSLPSPGPPYNVVSVYALKNLRRKMEDRHVVIHDLNTMFNVQKASPSSYYAIFDGHAGHDAAAYSSAHLHQFLAESKHFIHNPEQALIDAFCKTDTLFIDKCKVEKLSSGTTAVCALLRPKEKTLYIAWVGDSQALLVNQGKVLQCVAPHKPSREDEKKRIEQNGGIVIYWGTWRVNGQLAVSRAIGDAEYKPYVTATPDVQEIPLNGGEDFLILACDGLWDFLSEDDAACAVYTMVCNNPDDTGNISHHLAQLAKQQGSTDNISVIVVFLREPSKVAADAHWANRNRLTMEAGLDNANATNNPFANSNGTEILQQKDGFLLNLTEGFKQNGAELSPSNEYVFDRPSNGKRTAEEFDEDEDMGPETDVDAIDDALSPTTEQANIDNKNIGEFDPFTADIEEKATLEMDLDIQKQQTSEFEPPRTPREETPTPPADEVHDAGVEDNVGDSGEDSEDEWNYYKGDTAESEKVSSSKADQEVAELTRTVEEDEESAMSQLNPNAAEFVPISSPTRNVASPACRALINDEVIAQSPRRATPSDIDINLPSPQDFEKEVKNRPSDVYSNGQDTDNNQKLSSQEVMENLLNGKNIEDIEFHPGTPHKSSNTEEFHFGPNATPFSTPVKYLDQSEAALSTKAVVGDESSYLEGKTLGLESSFVTEDSSNANPFTAEDDIGDFQPQVSKSTDPMSMSFYQDENERNPFDLNKVQMLPDDDELLGKTDNNGQLRKAVSNPPAHDSLAASKQEFIDSFIPTDNADSNLLCGISQLPKTPEPILEKSTDALFSDLPLAKSPILIEASNAPLPITPEPNSEEQENINSQKTPDVVSPLPEDNDLLDVDSRSSPLSFIPPKSSSLGVEAFTLDEVTSANESNLVGESNDNLSERENITPLVLSPEPTDELNELLNPPKLVDDGLCQEVLGALGESDSKYPVVATPEPAKELLCQTKSFEPAEFSKSPVPTLEPDVNSEVIEKTEKIEEFFLICQKNADSDSIEKTSREEEVIKEEFFPICSKSTTETDKAAKDEEFFPICPKSTINSDKAAKKEEFFPIFSKSSFENIKEENFFPVYSKSRTELFGKPTAVSPTPIGDDIEESELTKSPELTINETEFKSNSPTCLDNLINISSKSIPNTEVESRSPEPEYPTKSPIPTIGDIEISPKLQEPIIDTYTENILKITESADILETQTETPEPTFVDIPAEGEIKPSPAIEHVECLAKPHKLILDNLELQPISPEPQQDILPDQLLECVPPVCEKPLVEHLLTTPPELITDTINAEVEINNLLQQTAEPDLKPIDNEIEMLTGKVPITPEPTEIKEVLEPSEQLLVDEIQNILDTAESAALIESEAKSPETVEESLDSEKRDVESPMEDITSSIKDDNSLTPEIIEEAKDISTEKETVRDNFTPMFESQLQNTIINFAQESASTIQPTETIRIEKETCQISSTPNTTLSEATDTESVNTAEINSFLEKCNIPDVTSPLSPTEESLQQVLDAHLSNSHNLPTEDVVKTDLITPQYPEEAVITPSEETKLEIPTPVVEEKEAPAALPEVALEAKTKDKVDETIVAAVGAAAVAATAAAVTSIVKEKKIGKPSTKTAQSLADKRLKLGQTPAKSPTTKPTSIRAPATAKSTVPSPTKLVPSKISKTTTLKATPAPKAAPKPPLTKPKIDSTIAKSSEKKPLMNGDLKAPAKSIGVKKLSITPTKAPTTTKNPVTAKPSPIKSETKLTATKVGSLRVNSSISATKSTTTTTTTSTTSTAPKPRPTSLPSKTVGSTSTTKTSTVSATKATVQSKVGTTASSPKTTTAKPKPPTSLTSKSPTVPKPKLSLTKTTTIKGPGTEKQIKDSVNKQLTATSRISTRTAGTTSTGKTTTTIKKTETKSPSTRTTSTTKTTVTAIKSTNKKPAEVTRLTGRKPAPTKTTTIKTQQNGLTNGVTTTVVQETTTILSTESQLIKDLSPVENKLLVDNSQLSETNVAD